MKLQHPVLPLIPALITLLETEIAKTQLSSGSGLVLNFRDPDYSAESGGFHPVEMALDPSGCPLYITDFAYFGDGYFAELAKELDFDFSYGLFQQFGQEYPIHAGAELFQLWQENFVSYYQAGVFQVSVSAL